MHEAFTLETTDEKSDSEDDEYREDCTLDAGDKHDIRNFTTECLLKLQAHMVIDKAITPHCINVFRVTDGVYGECVLKMMPFLSPTTRAPKEVRVLQAAQKASSAVVQLHRWFRFDDGYAILMQHIPSVGIEDLFEESDQIRSFMHQLLETLQALYEHNIMHRDIKPSNVRWHQGKLTLIDFDMATFNPDRLRLHSRGHDGFMSPEMMKNQGYTAQNDVYSCGVLMGMILTNQLDQDEIDTALVECWRKLPSDKRKRRRIRTNREEYIYEFKQTLLSTDAHAADLVDKMLNPNPNKRPTFAQCLTHPYFLKVKDIQ